MGVVNQPAFMPEPGTTVNQTFDATGERVQWRTGNDSTGMAKHCRAYNSGAVTVFLEFGGSSVTASVTTSMPIAPGAVEIFRGPGDYVAGKTSTSSAVCYFTPGEGI